MQFDSLTFIVFLGPVILWYGLARSWNSKKNILLLASYIFYAAWNVFFLPLLLFSTTLDYSLARWLHRCEGRWRKFALLVTVCANLSILFFFKYAGFALEIINDLLHPLGVSLYTGGWNIILPLGISFYTFHSLSYCIDVYRRKFAPTRSWRDYSLYVAFFPQLVAGPITRWTQMRDQIEQPRQMAVTPFFIGLAMLLVGLFEKIVLADNVFAPVANEIFALSEPATTQAWLGMIAFSGQIFCDFAGYSNCALGLALMLGFRLPANFLNPYSAIGFSDFWRRWHVSLSTWLRDYLYIPLGGNRHGRLLTYRNLMLTMLLGGLWHGAAWTFVIWGFLHGSYLMVERLVQGIYRTLGLPAPGVLLRSMQWILTLVAVMYAWVWFRADSIQQALQLSIQMLDLSALLGNLDHLGYPHWLVLGVFGSLLLVQLACRNQLLPQWLENRSLPVLGLLYCVLLLAIILSPGEGNAFIYFQF